MTQINLSVPDISCDHCKHSIEEAVGALAGVESVEVGIESKVVAVDFDDTSVSPDQIVTRHRGPGVRGGRLNETESPDLTFEVEGMTCTSCAIRVEHILSRQPEVDSATVDFATRDTVVSLSDRVEPEDLRQAVQRIGYDLHVVTDDDPAHHSDEHAGHGSSWRSFWWAAAISAPLLVLGMFGPDATWDRRAPMGAGDAGGPHPRLAVPPQHGVEAPLGRRVDGHLDLGRDPRRIWVFGLGRNRR